MVLLHLNLANLHPFKAANIIVHQIFIKGRLCVLSNIMPLLFLSALHGYEDKGRAHFSCFLNTVILAIKISLLGAKYITKKKRLQRLSLTICKAMGDLGLLGVSTPAEIGGIGGTFKDESIVCEEMTYAMCSRSTWFMFEKYIWFGAVMSINIYLSLKIHFSSILKIIANVLFVILNYVIKLFC